MTSFFKEKHRWVIAAYMVLYLAGFWLLEQREIDDYHIIHTGIDDKLPFCELFILPYLFWFFFIAAAVLYFAFRNENVTEYWQLMLTLGIGMTLFLAVSWLWPNMQQLRPEVFERENIFTELTALLYRADTPTNIFPSIHVFNSVAVCAAVYRCQALREKRALKLSVLIISILIVASTMFLKQHSFLDVCCALLLNLFLYKLFYLPLPAILWKREGFLRPAESIEEGNNSGASF